MPRLAHPLRVLAAGSSWWTFISRSPRRASVSRACSELIPTRFSRRLSSRQWSRSWCSRDRCWLAYDVAHDLPTAAQLRDVGSMSQATTLYDKDNHAAFTIFQERRVETSLSEISPHLVHAIVAIEDQRFYDHGGVDLVRIVAAAVNNLRVHRAAQGGSTLTQQLARQSFLTSDKTLRRKLKETVLAWRLEREFTKDQILEMYLNKVYFGDGLYGIEAASLGFFGKHARDLDVAESAMLAGLVKSPSTYAPTINLDRAVSRRNVVLQAMRDSHAIDRATYEPRGAKPPAAGRRAPLRRSLRAVFQGRSPEAARAALRMGSRLPGRVEGLHDDRSRTCRRPRKRRWHARSPKSSSGS